MKDLNSLNTKKKPRTHHNQARPAPRFAHCLTLALLHRKEKTSQTFRKGRPTRPRTRLRRVARARGRRLQRSPSRRRCPHHLPSLNQQPLARLARTVCSDGRHQEEKKQIKGGIGIQISLCMAQQLVRFLLLEMRSAFCSRHCPP